MLPTPLVTHILQLVINLEVALLHLPKKLPQDLAPPPAWWPLPSPHNSALLCYQLALDLSGVQFPMLNTGAFKLICLACR